MVIISECRTCNADKATCPIRTGLRIKLANIKERLKYKCTGWQAHLKYKVGDKIEFHFIEYSSDSPRLWELSVETLIGVIISVSKKRPIYQVMIDKENRAMIKPERDHYDKYVMPHDVFEESPTHFDVPVKEKYIKGLVG
jgi:hypothetical protein